VPHCGGGRVVPGRRVRGGTLHRAAGRFSRGAHPFSRQQQDAGGNRICDRRGDRLFCGGQFRRACAIGTYRRGKGGAREGAASGNARRGGAHARIHFDGTDRFQVRF